MYVRGMPGVKLIPVAGRGPSPGRRESTANVLVRTLEPAVRIAFLKNRVIDKVWRSTPSDDEELA